MVENLSVSKNIRICVAQLVALKYIALKRGRAEEKLLVVFTYSVYTLCIFIDGEKINKWEKCVHFMAYFTYPPSDGNTCTSFKMMSAKKKKEENSILYYAIYKVN